jgi:hypothetical protein
MLDALGWIATGSSRAPTLQSQGTLRRVQACAALLWIGYGLAIGSAPVIASNVLVAAIAAYSSLERRPRASEGAPDPSS